MLANAATGSSKNIVPNLLIARSKRSGGKRWTCASACSKVTLRSPSARASSRARSIAGAEMSTPSALPARAVRAASPGRLPGPTADVEDVVVELDAARPAQYLVVPPQFGVVAAEAGQAAMPASGHQRLS